MSGPHAVEGGDPCLNPNSDHVEGKRCYYCGTCVDPQCYDMQCSSCGNCEDCCGTLGPVEDSEGRERWVGLCCRVFLTQPKIRAVCRAALARGSWSGVKRCVDASRECAFARIEVAEQWEELPEEGKKLWLDYVYVPLQPQGIFVCDNRGFDPDR